MIATLLDLMSWLLVVTGAVFLLIGGLGLLRFPDFYARLQAASITDSLSTISIVLGLMLQADSVPVAAKLLFTLLFMLFTAPTASLALIRAARHGKLDPWQAEKAEKGGASSPR